MFKLKAGNVFQKMNKMDKKQAYTWGGIIIACFLALMMLASFLGKAEDTSFDEFNSRGYDLAQMPFVNDEAEEYLLASKYPDMQNNGSTMLYSNEDKEKRQAEDAKNAEEEDSQLEEDSASDDSSSSQTSRPYYGGRGGSGGGSGSPTHVGTLGSASMGRAGGSGVGGSWGAPRGDFSPYHNASKGEEAPAQFKNTDARKALYQFAQTSRAAAGLKNDKGVNAKRALMGGGIQGSEAFTDSGVDLSKAGGLQLDTNAPVTTADLSNLGDKLKNESEKAKDAKKEAEEEFAENMEEDFWDRLLATCLESVINYAGQAVTELLNWGTDAISGAISGASANKEMLKQKSAEIFNTNKIGDLSADDQAAFVAALNKKTGKNYTVDSLPKDVSPYDFYKNNNEYKSNGSTTSPAYTRNRESEVPVATVPSGDDGSGDLKDFRSNLKKAAKDDKNAHLQISQDYDANSDMWKTNTKYRDNARENNNNNNGNNNTRSNGNTNTSRSVSDITNDSKLTSDDKVKELEKAGLSREAACLQVYRRKDCK